MDITHYAFARMSFYLYAEGSGFSGRFSNPGKKGVGWQTGPTRGSSVCLHCIRSVEDMLNSFEEYAEKTKKETEANTEKGGRTTRGSPGDFGTA